MPVPAVYLPQRGLPPDIRGMWGFEPIATRHGDKAIPYASRDGLTLAADIRKRDAMDLLIVPAAAFTGTGEPARIDNPQLLAAGRFPEPHPPAWKEVAYAAQSLLAVIGPDDLRRWIQRGRGRTPLRRTPVCGSSKRRSPPSIS